MSQQNPALQQGKLSPATIIRIICIVYGALFLFQVLSHAESYAAIIPDLRTYGLKGVIILIFLILIPLSLVLLLVKEKGGWILLMFDLVYSLVSSLYRGFKMSTGVFEPSSPSMVTRLVLTFVIVVGVMIGLTRKEVLRTYQITNNNILVVVILGVALFGYMYFI
jgi:hypothetical protein